MVDFFSILKVMLRQPIGPVLIVFQFAFSGVLLSYTLMILERRAEVFLYGDHVGDDIFYIHVSPNDRMQDINLMIDQDLAMIRSHEHVLYASSAYSIPLNAHRFSSWYWTDQHQYGGEVLADYYGIDEFGIRALGLNLIEGRDFNAADVVSIKKPHLGGKTNVVISQKLAQLLFQKQDALNKIFYGSKNIPLNVIGVVEDVPGLDEWDHRSAAVFFPDALASIFRIYIVRAKPGFAVGLADEIEFKLREAGSNRLVRGAFTWRELERQAYGKERSMLKLLVAVAITILLICFLAVIGLVWFLLVKRRRQISIRLALGASRSSIISSFILELIYFLLFSLLLGLFLVVVFEPMLNSALGFTGLPVKYVSLSFILLLLISLPAVYFPVRWATRLAPATYIRN